MFNEQSLIGSVTEVREDVNLVTVETADGSIVNAKWLPNGRPTIGLGVILNPTDSGGYTAVAKNAIRQPAPELPKPKPKVPDELAVLERKGIIACLDPKLFLLSDPFKFAERPYVANSHYNGNLYLTSTPAGVSNAVEGSSIGDLSGDMTIPLATAFANVSPYRANEGILRTSGDPSDPGIYAAYIAGIAALNALQVSLAVLSLESFNSRYARSRIDWQSYRENVEPRASSATDSVLSSHREFVKSIFEGLNVVIIDLFNSLQGSVPANLVEPGLHGVSGSSGTRVDSAYLWLIPYLIDEGISVTRKTVSQLTEEGPQPDTLYLVTEDQFKFRYDHSSLPNASAFAQNSSDLVSFIKDACKNSLVLMLIGSEDETRVGHGVNKVIEFDVNSFVSSTAESLTYTLRSYFTSAWDSDSTTSQQIASGSTNPATFKSSDGLYTFWPSKFNNIEYTGTSFRRLSVPRFSPGREYGYQFGMWGLPDTAVEEKLIPSSQNVLTVAYSAGGWRNGSYDYSTREIAPSMDTLGILPPNVGAWSYSQAELNEGRAVGDYSSLRAISYSITLPEVAAGELYLFGGGYFENILESDSLVIDWNGNTTVAHFTPERLNA
jgi:hypothetical protein